MAQVFSQLEKIGQISESGGVVTLAASRITIGGQQYITGSLNLTLSGLAVNTRYMIYAVLSAGIVTLVKSTNVNSVGPAGFTAWKLVGAFYSNYASAFGSFVNIEGVPRTELFSGGPVAFNGGTPPVKGSATILKDEILMQVIGSDIRVNMTFHKTASGTAANGTGDYRFSMPTNFSAKIPPLSATTTSSGGANSNQFHLTHASWFGGVVGAQSHNGFVSFYDANSFVGNSTSHGSTSNAWGTIGSTFNGLAANASISYCADFTVPGVGLSNTPLKDL